MNKQEKELIKKTEASDNFITTVSKDDFDAELFSKKLTDASFSTYVRVLMQNWRQGTVGCKGRSDVDYSNKKPWKQKGTGRARSGSSRSPLWRGGGVTFGPQARTRTLAITKKVKKGVLANVLSTYIDGKKIARLNWMPEGDKPSTAGAFAALKKAGLEKQKLIVFVPFNDQLSFASFANLSNVKLLFFDQPNVVDLAQGARWIVLNKDFDQFKEMVSKWI